MNSYFQVGFGGQFTPRELEQISKALEGGKLLDYDHQKGLYARERSGFREKLFGLIGLHAGLVSDRARKFLDEQSKGVGSLANKSWMVLGSTSFDRFQKIFDAQFKGGVLVHNQTRPEPIFLRLLRLFGAPPKRSAIDSSILEVHETQINVREMRDLQAALGAIMGKQGAQGKVLASFTYKEGELQQELLKGQTWPQGKPFDSYSDQLIADVTRSKPRMRGGAPIEAVRGKDAKSKLAAVAAELRMAMPTLTEQQIYILLELMTQTVSASLTALTMGPNGEWFEGLMQQGCMSKVDSDRRDVGYSFEGNKAIVTIRIPLYIVHLGMSGEKGPLILKTAMSTQTCVLDLRTNRLEMKIIRTGYTNTLPVEPQGPIVGK